MGWGFAEKMRIKSIINFSIGARSGIEMAISGTALSGRKLISGRLTFVFS
jgi:hypothetical protein